MKKLFLKMSAILLASLMVFASCKHDVKNNKGEDTPNDLPSLKLEKLSIHGEKVNKNQTTNKYEITLSEEQIIAKNIEAHFSYDSVSDEKITVVVKDSPFVLDKTKPKTLHISVPAKKNTYKAWDEDIEVSWKKEKEPSQDLITKASLVGSYDKGVQFSATSEQINKLIKNDGLVLEIKGPNAILLFGSNKVTWSKCIINEKEIPFQPWSALGFKSVTMVNLDMPQVGQTNEYKILVEAGDKKQETSFKIKRLEGTVDIPHLKLFIVGKDVISDENLPKLFDGTRPQFKGTDPCHIEVRCQDDAVTSCVIDESSPINMQKKTVGKDEIYYAEHSATGIDPTNGKDIDVVVHPKNTNDYHDTVWKFHLNYQAKTPMSVVYTLNNKARRQLDQQFVKDLEEGKKPTLTLTNASFLNMKLDAKAKIEEIKINDVSFKNEALIDNGVGILFYHSFPVTASEQEIKIVLTPKDKGRYAEKVFEFKVKGDGNKEKLSPSLVINEKNDFSDEFMESLTNGSKPTHKVFNSPANIEVYVDEYAYTFLTNKLKINGEEVEIQKEKHGLKYFYLAKKAIDVTGAEAKDVKIEFIPKKDGIFDTLFWEFKVQGGAEKSVFPKDKVSLFTINGIGGFGEPLPKDLLDNLTTGNPYTYVIDKNQAVIEVGWYADVNELLEHAIFEVDGVPNIVSAVRRSNAYICSHTVQLPDQTEHTVKIKMVPKADSIYKELVYSFKIKNSGQLPKLPLKFWVENLPILDGTEKELETDMPIVSVTSEEDNDEEIMNEVTINGESVTIQTQKAQNGDGFFYEAAKGLDISVSDYTDVTISVTPKDTSKYRTTTCTFKLKAKKAMPKDNGKFEFSGDKVRGGCAVEWVDDEPREVDNDHGAKSVIITVYTESPHAKVKYKSMFFADDKDGNEVFNVDLTSYEYATHIGNKHITKKIKLDQDKSVTIKAEVEPDEGATDPDKGVIYFTFNPVIVLWNYSEGTTHATYPNAFTELEDASGVKTPVIKVSKTSIVDGKIYLALSAWKADFGCNVGDTAKFIPLNENGDTQWYKATIDVSSLNTQTDELDVSFPLLFNNKPSFTYKFKIKLQ